MKQLRTPFYIAALITFMVSCRIAKPVIPENVTAPEKFSDTTDTTTVADNTWTDFFTSAELRKLIDTALRSNPDLEIATQRIQMANATLLASRNALYPSVNIVASAAADKYGDYTLNGVGNFDTNLSPNISKDQRIPGPTTPDFFLGLRSSWEIDIWGKLKNRRKAAMARAEGARYSAQFLKTLVVSEVAGFYYTLIALDNELKIVKRNIVLQETGLEMVKIQKEAGFVTELAVQQFNAQLLSTKASEFRVRQEIIAVENSLNNTVGRFPTAVMRDSLIAVLGKMPEVKTGLPKEWILRRPDLRDAEARLRAASADVLAARAAFYPTLSISPYAGFNAFKAPLLFDAASLAYGVLGGIMAPIFNQKQLRAQHQFSIAQNKEVYQSYRRTMLNAWFEVATGMQNLINLQNSYQFKQQEVQELQKAVASAREIYLAGKASYLEIIAAQKGVLDAELELNNLHKELFTGKIELYRALGGGWR